MVRDKVAFLMLKSNEHERLILCLYFIFFTLISSFVQASVFGKSKAVQFFRMKGKFILKSCKTICHLTMQWNDEGQHTKLKKIKQQREESK